MSDKHEDNNNTFHGTNGNDVVHGKGNQHKFYGSNGDDTIYGTNGNDTIYGDKGNDTLYGNAGNDKLYGGEGSDKLYGGTGSNVLQGGGGVGQDTYYLTGGQANPDTLVVHPGDSQFQYGANTVIGSVNATGAAALLALVGTVSNFDRVYGFDKYDKIDLDSANPKNNGHPQTMANIEKISAEYHTAHIDGYVIKDGIISFGKLSPDDAPNSKHFDADDMVKIDTIALAKEAYHFLATNCCPKNLDKVVAMYIDIDIAGPKHTILVQAHSDTNATAIDFVGHFPQITHQVI